MKNLKFITALAITLLPILSVQAQDKVSTDITAGFACAQVVPCVAPDFNVLPIFLNGQCDQFYIELCAKAKADFNGLADKKKARRQAQRAMKNNRYKN